MGGSPTEAQLRNPIYPADRFGIQFEVDNKPYEEGINKVIESGILGVLGAGAAGAMVSNLLASPNMTEEEKKKQILKGMLTR